MEHFSWDRVGEDEVLVIIPELNALKTVREKSVWHATEENVWEHTKRVMERLAENLGFEYLEPAVRDRYLKYFDESMEGTTRREMLLMAGWLHDIGKSETLRELEGSWRCPGHEEKGANMVAGIDLVGRLELTGAEAKRLENIVRWHDLPHQAMEEREEDGVKQKLVALGEDYLDIALEVVVLAKADTEGSDLSLNDAQEFERRMKLYVHFLNHPDEWLLLNMV